MGSYADMKARMAAMRLSGDLGVVDRPMPVTPSRDLEAPEEVKVWVVARITGRGKKASIQVAGDCIHYTKMAAEVAQRGEARRSPGEAIWIIELKA